MRMPNQIWIGFSQEADVGVKWNVTLRWAWSQFSSVAWLSSRMTWISASGDASATTSSKAVQDELQLQILDTVDEAHARGASRLLSG